MTTSKKQPNWLARIVVAVVLVAGVYFGWKWLTRVEEVGTGGAEDLAAVGEAAERRLVQFLLGEGEPELRLTGTEMTALLRFTYRNALPPGVTETWVSLADSSIEVRLRSEPAKIPELPDLGPVLRRIVPDTVDVRVKGRLSISDGRAMFLVDRIGVLRVTLPEGLVPPIITAIGRGSAPSLPANSIVATAPPSIGEARIEDGVLVLVRR